MKDAIIKVLIMDKDIQLRILCEIAKEGGLELCRLVDDVYRLKRGNKKFYIRGRDFSLNSALSYHFCRNKGITYEILKDNKIPAVPHYEIYQPLYYAYYGDQRKRNKRRVKLIIKKEHLPIVVKPARGCSGQGVGLYKSKHKIMKAAKKLFVTEKEVVLSPYRKIEHEYRVIMLNGKPELIFDKIKPVMLKKRHMEFRNLAYGADVEVVDEKDERYDKIAQLAKRSYKCIGFEFASVDVIDTEEHGLEILEINSSVCMSHFAAKRPEYYQTAKQIYKKALKKALKG
jgi:glutathione synthase/RimK-type ligase-like ATP-grasp enzyme